MTKFSILLSVLLTFTTKSQNLSTLHIHMELTHSQFKISSLYFRFDNLYLYLDFQLLIHILDPFTYYNLKKN